MTARTKDIHMVFRNEHESPTSAVQTPDPLTPSQPLVAVQTKDINMASSGCSELSYQYEWQHSPWSSVWVQDAAQPMDIYMVFSDNMGHVYQHRPLDAVGPQTWSLVAAQTGHHHVLKWQPRTIWPLLQHSPWTLTWAQATAHPRGLWW